MAYISKPLMLAVIMQLIVYSQEFSWTHYKTTGPHIAPDHVSAIDFDLDGSVWFGHVFFGGISRFDGSDWTYYDSRSSGIPNDAMDCINSMVIDSNGNSRLSIVN
jgi:hypothetical protein